MSWDKSRCATNLNHLAQSDRRSSPPAKVSSFTGRQARFFPPDYSRFKNGDSSAPGGATDLADSQNPELPSRGHLPTRLFRSCFSSCGSMLYIVWPVFALMAKVP